MSYGLQLTQSSETERYNALMAASFPFMHASRIMDAQKRRPDHPEYDPSTLYIPPNWFKVGMVMERDGCC